MGCALNSERQVSLSPEQPAQASSRSQGRGSERLLDSWVAPVEAGDHQSSANNLQGEANDTQCAHAVALPDLRTVSTHGHERACEVRTPTYGSGRS